MATTADVRDAVLKRENGRHTEDLRAQVEATLLELEIDRQRRKVEAAEKNLDRQNLILRALEAQRKPERE